jgi:hypothetical protein
MIDGIYGYLMKESKKQFDIGMSGYLRKEHMVKANKEEIKRREMAGLIAHNLVMTVDWPWNDRQQWLWYVGVLADTNRFMMDYLESLSIDQLQTEYRKTFKKDDN